MPNTLAMGQFGDKFRKAREARKLSLDDVSNVTKIASRMLQAIEQEDFDQLPGGVFNRGFIRAYAKHLGLDPEEAVTEYLACLRQAQIDAQTAQYQQVKAAASEKRPLVAANRQSSKTQPPAPSQIQSSQTQSSQAQSSQAPSQVLAENGELPDLQLPRIEHVRPPRRGDPDGRKSGFSWRLLTAALMLALVFVLWRNYRATHAAVPPTASAATGVASPPAKSLSSRPMASPATGGADSAAAPVPVSKSSIPVNPRTVAVVQIPHPFDAPSPRSGLLRAGSVGQTATRVGQPNADNSATTPKSPNGESNTSVGDQNDVTVRPLRPNPKPSAPLLTLVIRASETSWISVTADGKTVSQEKLIAPAHTSVRAGREIAVHVGNAAGISFLWNGAEIAAQGGEGEVKDFIFDTQGMRVISQTPPQSQTQNN